MQNKENQKSIGKALLLVIESIAFLVVLGAVLVAVSGLLERKNSRNQFGPFLKDPQAYDVLFFGDSVTVNAIAPMEIWLDKGIPSYNLSCYGNTIPISYWSMINALDYAKPRVVVISVSDVKKELKVTGSSSDVHTALDYLPLSLNKIRAVEDLMSDPQAEDDEGRRYVDMKGEYLFTLGKYHDRWNQLTPGDWRPQDEVENGAKMSVGVAQVRDYELVDEDDCAEEWGGSYVYLRRMIETCQERGIEVMLFMPPYVSHEETQRHANTVRSIAESYDIAYVNMIALDSIVDYDTDSLDHQAHLNVSGSMKVSAYLADYLANHYDLPDRRDEPAYKGWEKRTEAYRDLKWNRIVRANGLKNLLMLLHDDDFDVQIFVRPDAELYAEDQSILLMHNIAREHVTEENEYSMYSNFMFPLEVFDEAIAENAPYLLTMQNGQAQEEIGKQADQMAQAVFGEAYEGDSCSVLVKVCDPRTGKVETLVL